jgi:hypothetical protein
MLETHQAGVVEPTAAPFAVRIDMIDGEVLPGQFRTAAGRGSDPGIRRIPKDTSLLRTEAALRVLAGEQTTENTAQNFFSLATLVYVVSRLRDSDQVCAIQLLMKPGAFGFTLKLAHLIHASGERLQQIPG